jgi:8-oxo-dGTP pyrophosphatase MutT (NUDIX family)
MPFNVALILLYDSAGKVLLQHRTDDAQTLPGHWAFFGGQLDAGELPLDAVRRETKEELDYDLDNPELVFTHEFHEWGKHVCLYVFGSHFCESPSILSLREGQGWGWYDRQGIVSLKMCERDRQILSRFWQWLADKKNTENVRSCAKSG